MSSRVNAVAYIFVCIFCLNCHLVNFKITSSYSNICYVYETVFGARVMMLDGCKTVPCHIPAGLPANANTSSISVQFFAEIVGAPHAAFCTFSCADKGKAAGYKFALALLTYLLTYSIFFVIAISGVPHCVWVPGWLNPPGHRDYSK